MQGCLSTNFWTYMAINFRDTIEIVAIISAKEIGKLGLPVPRAFLHCFQKGVHWTAHIEEVYISIKSNLKDSKFYKLGFL